MSSSPQKSVPYSSRCLLFKCLTYYQAPTGALFWLKCYGRGKEERIFTIKEGGKQQWW